jgi:hypothetical protein
LPIGGDTLPFVNFANMLIENVGHLNMEIKYVWPGLVANVQQVFESFGNKKSCSLSVSLQQTISGNSRSHSNQLQPAGINRLRAGMLFAGCDF